MLGLVINHVIRSLQKLDPEHPYIKGVEEKSDQVDKAASKFAAKVGA
jgi:hypothetical protein